MLGFLVESSWRLCFNLCLPDVWSPVSDLKTGVFLGAFIWVGVLGGVLLRVVYDFGSRIWNGDIFFPLE